MVLQVARHLAGRHLLQVELEAAGQHRHRHLLGIGGGQDEDDVAGRFLQGLQHGVEGAAWRAVHLVDDVDLVAAGGGRVLGVLDHLAHVVDAGVGGGVDLDQVDEAAAVDLLAGGADAAGFRA
jgi:hypothetical protein